MKIVFLSGPYENLGIEYLSASLKSAGFETDIVIDPCLFSEPGFIQSDFLSRAFSLRRRVFEELARAKPEMVCISAMTDTYQWALSWAREIKSRLSVPIVLGGIHATCSPEAVMKEECFDYLCVGEGEAAIVELAQAVRQKRETSGIANIWFRLDGKIIGCAPRPPAAPDSLPLPDKELYRSRYPFFKGQYLIGASRGCALSCSYCCNSVYAEIYKGSSPLRLRTVDNVLAELSAERPSFVHFTDEALNFDSGWFLELLEKYRRQSLPPFSCYLFPDLVDGKQAAALKKAGCVKAQLGVQIADDEKRFRVLNRPSRLERIANALDCLGKAGVYTVCDSLLGIPDETEEEISALCRFYLAHKPDANEVFFLACYPKTPITRWAAEKGFISAPEISAVEKGLRSGGIIRPPSGLKPFSAKMALFISAIPLLPRRFSEFVLSKRLYRFSPAGLGVCARIILRLFKHPRHDFYVSEFVKRYAYFCLLKIRLSLRFG